MLTSLSHPTLLVFFLLFTSIQCQGNYLNEEEALMETQFKDYDPKIRPVLFNDSVVEVNLDYWFVSLLDIEERSQLLSAFGWMQLTWKDDFLKWSLNNYNLTYMVVNVKDIWYPDLVVRNSAEAIYGDIFDYEKYKAPIYNDGMVYFYTAGQTKTFCRLDLTFFPFDVQACYIHVDSWTYSNSQLVISNKSSVQTQLYNPNGQWTLIKTGSAIGMDSFNGEAYSEVKFNFYLKRKPLYFMTNLIIPCCLMSVIVLFVFLLPANADEKISLSITVLLSFSVFQLLVVGSMPETSDYVPLITIYITFVMFMSAASLFSTILVLMLHHHNHLEPPPKWLATLAFNYLDKVLCTSLPAFCKKQNDGYKIDLVKQTPSETQQVKNNGVDDRVSEKKDYWLKVKRTLLEKKQDGLEGNSNMAFSLDQADNVEGRRGQLRREERVEVEEERPESFQMSSIFQLVTTSLARINNEKRSEEVKKQWAHIAVIFDRLFLVVFLTITLGVAVMLLGVAPHFGPEIVEPYVVS